MSGCVTLHAIFKIGNTFFAMFALHIAGRMLVTAITLVSLQIIFVADLANVSPVLAVIDRKGMRLGVLSWSPVRSTMADRAISIEQALVKGRLRVASRAINRDHLQISQASRF